MYLSLKFVHTTLAALAIAGFLLRGYWHYSGSRLVERRLTKVLPHAVDAVFLLTGIALTAMLHLNPLQHPWLLAKFAGLGAYIGFGMLAFRFGRSAGVRLVAFVAAVAAFAYVVGAALSKSPMSWLALAAAG